MKYLKLFEDITSDGLIYIPNQEEITNDIKDMFVYLIDDQFDISLQFNELQQYDRYYYVNISFRKEIGFFNIDQVKDSILMSIDYIKDKWEEVSVKYDVNWVKSDKLPIYGSETSKFSKINDIPKNYIIDRVTVMIEKVKPKKNFIQKFKNIFR